MILWKKELIEPEELSIWLYFGPTAFRRGGDTKPIIKEIRKMESFQLKIIQLCREFKFNVSDPKYIQIPRPPGSKFIGPQPWFRLQSGRLQNNVGLGLIKVVSENRKYIENFRNHLAKTKIENETQKRGKPKTPEFFAYHVIIGIDLFKGSAAHLNELKQYLEAGSQFEKWIEGQIQVGLMDSKFKKTIVSLFVKNKSKLELAKWPRSKRQSMVKALYADKSKKATKRKGEDEETNIIEKNIEKKIRAFLERVSKT
jgi:hypothetical protein